MNKTNADAHNKHDDRALKATYKIKNKLTSIGMSAKADGQALGPELAGLEYEAAIEVD